MLAITGLGGHPTRLFLGGTAALHTCQVWGAVTFPGGNVLRLIQNPFSDAEFGKNSLTCQANSQ